MQAERKHLLAVVGGALMILILASCGGPDLETADGANGPGDPAAERTPLEVAANKIDEIWESDQDPEQKLAALRGFLDQYPESDHTGPFVDRACRVMLEDLEQPDEAYLFIEDIMARVEDPEVEFEVEQKLALIHARTGHIDELRELVETMIDERELRFTNYYEQMELAEEVEAWQLVIDVADASLVTANAEAFLDQYDDVTQAEAELWGARRKAFAASMKGWAEANLGRFEAAQDTFALALPHTTYSLLGGDETPLHFKWAKALMLAGDPEGCLEKLGSMATFGQDEEQELFREAYVAAHGSQEGLDATLQELREQYAQPLPEFALANYEGETWSTRQSEGDVLLIAAWHPT